ncbi:hypothetical protein B0H17DRAFT_1335615 [Mycena rosella]|uniref:Uncharacterized protein n=1 Tax=Mycena rosella TaxID=1033263 RepID=A0AAD7CZ10_MYCRO|nr:hypothetical protein B0H17DRAFT_1335615 [Mycena rosella]
MSTPSVRKDRFNVIGIYKVPPHLTKKELEAKLEAFVDEFLALPVVQQTALKMEMSFRNDLLNDHVKVLGYTPAEPAVLITAQTERHAESAIKFYFGLAGQIMMVWAI